MRISHPISDLSSLQGEFSLTSGVKPSVSWESGSTSLQSLLPGFSATQWRREQVSLVRPRAAARWSRLVEN